MRVRLLGVTASNLGEREQLALFERDDPRQRRAVEAADALRRRYGERTVTRARLLGHGPAGAVRARPAEPARSAGAGRAGRRRRRRPRAGDSGRDSQGDTDVDEIPPDDA